MSTEQEMSNQSPQSGPKMSPEVLQWFMDKIDKINEQTTKENDAKTREKIISTNK